jgi:hypothetical protein
MQRSTQTGICGSVNRCRSSLVFFLTYPCSSISSRLLTIGCPRKFTRQ